MLPLIPYSAGELLDRDRRQLKTIRGKLFLHNSFKDQSPEFKQALVDFAFMLSQVQDLRDWSVLAEPGLTAFMLEDEGEDDKSIEEARELDRNSIETHARIARDFEEAGGKEEFQRRIDRLNNLAAKEGVHPGATRDYLDTPDFSIED